MVSLYKAMTSLQPIVLRSYTASTASAVAKLLLRLVIFSAQEASESPMPGREHCVKTLLSLSAPMSVFEGCWCLGIV